MAKTGPELTEKQLEEVRAAYEQTGKIAAIRKVIEHLSLGLADSKKLVERLAGRERWTHG